MKLNVSKIFGPESPAWFNDSRYNKIFLEQQKLYFGGVLRNRGYVPLNEVLDSLGISRTKFGQTNGWIYSIEKDKLKLNFDYEEFNDGRFNIIFLIDGDILHCLDD